MENKNDEAQFVCVSTQVMVQLRAEIAKEDNGMYSSRCPALDVFSQGYSEKEAKENLIEAIQLMIEVRLEDGSFAKWMKKCGFARASKDAMMWAFAREKAKTKSAPASKTAIVNIPIALPSVAAYC